MTAFIARVTAVVALVMVCSAHIGSPDAWYDGPAGPYRVLVHVQAPHVVPGIAVVNVKVASEGVSRVTAFVNRFDATGSAPPPDVASPLRDNPGWYRTQLWVMTAGSNGVTIGVHGPEGMGSVVVPLSATAGRRLEFNAGLATLLAAVGVFLALGLFTIVGAAVRESVLPPGVEPDASRVRRARHSIGRAAVVVLLVISAMAAWWRAADADFKRALFQPLAIATRIDRDTLDSRLTFTITDSAWLRRGDVGWLRARGKAQLSDLVQDHGKLVHLFLVAADTPSAIAHLHPSTSDTVSFTTALPPLPAGNYRVFADIVHASGFSQTLTSTIALAPDRSPSRNRAENHDDSWGVGLGDPHANSATLEDGSALTWLRGATPLVADTEAGLRFAFSTPSGDSARLEPYLGMVGHAVVARDDGDVFIHLHPMGTISLAAQTLLTQTKAEHRAHASSTSLSRSDTLYFPYAFPESGKYTIWVQVKRRGRVLTGAFVVDVAEREK
ncbi:MAG: hypothetical protein ACT4P6_11740 [Gemmatimonadaceae bacterium]